MPSSPRFAFFVFLCSFRKFHAVFIFRVFAGDKFEVVEENGTGLLGGNTSFYHFLANFVVLMGFLST